MRAMRNLARGSAARAGGAPTVGARVDGAPAVRALAVRGLVVAAVALGALTGCGSQATQPAYSPSVTVAPTASLPPATSPRPSATTPTAVPPTPSIEPSSPSVEADPARPAGQCPDDDLGVLVVPVDSGAGSIDYEVLFTNAGGTACELRGTPGISVVASASGPRIGPAATGGQSGVTTLTLQAGDTAQAALRITNIGTDGGPLPDCTVQRGAGYRVSPPHSSRAFFVEDPEAVACADGPAFMTIGPVTARTG